MCVNKKKLFILLSFADNEPPTITCPANQTNATDAGVDNVTLTLPDADAASDNAGSYTIAIDIASTMYSIGDSVTLDLATGEHLLQYIITDTAMNNATCDMYITVVGGYHFFLQLHMFFYMSNIYTHMSLLGNLYLFT